MNTEWMNKLTHAVTAFTTWAEMVEAMRGGYCPTLRPESRRQRLLARVVKASGFPVYLGASQWVR